MYPGFLVLRLARLIDTPCCRLLYNGKKGDHGGGGSHHCLREMESGEPDKACSCCLYSRRGCCGHGPETILVIWSQLRHCGFGLQCSSLVTADHSHLLSRTATLFSTVTKTSLTVPTHVGINSQIVKVPKSLLIPKTANTETASQVIAVGLVYFRGAMTEVTVPCVGVVDLRRSPPVTVAANVVEAIPVADATRQT